MNVGREGQVLRECEMILRQVCKSEIILHVGDYSYGIASMVMAVFRVHITFTRRQMCINVVNHFMLLAYSDRVIILLSNLYSVGLSVNHIPV